jgi:hypothetical protein
VIAFLAGKARAKDVTALTFFFKDAVTGFFPEPIQPGSDNHIFRELLVTVWNRILLRLQDAKVTEKEAEEIGVMLRRVWFFAQAYAERKKEMPLSEWIAKLSGVAKEAGVPLP